ncbi:hypothetical protein FE257_012265 [Aspergillus nanangensis]|uniref:FAD synthase n=1 Tax=Aspergillus nanangensis TaxID=2582783 RepID=A0AAD4CG79_ASPNN|nr:hypothetical protein FE257_012265 [Aspergillus nanangensis]
MSSSDEQDTLDALEREASEFTKDAEIDRIRKAFTLDAYAVLDLQPGVTEKDIKIQYRKKSLLIHPDKTKNPAAPDAFDRLKKAQTSLLDEKEREYLDGCIADARRLLIREHKYNLDSPELKTEEFKKEWRAKTVHVLLEEEARRRRQAKAKLQEEGRERRKEEEELDARKRKRDQDKAWEDTLYNSNNPPSQKDRDESTTQTPTTTSLADIIAQCHTQIHSFLAEVHPPDSLLAAVQRQTRISLDVAATALTRYQLHELSLSYNGGKDCLVLLVLFLASLHPIIRNDSTAAPSSLPAIYALPPDPFPTVEDFVRWSAHAYHLDIIKYTTDPPRSTLRSSFENYLSLNPGVKAIFVGTRRTDPHGAKLTHFDRTDHGWPDFVRVHPVIDWHYAEIWAFIRHLGLRYCPLYDQGYTSLGGQMDTHPNPKLRIDSSPIQDQNHRYRPAYELTEDLEERLGRN